MAKTAKRPLGGAGSALAKLAKYSKILDAFPDLVAEINEAGDCLAVYANSPGLLTLPPRKLLGRKIGATLPEPVAKSLMAAVRRAAAKGRMQLFDYQIDSPRDGMLCYEARIAPLRKRNLIVIIRDVTERRRAAERLEAALAEAEQANAAKSRFLAAASHDLRQPLQSAQLFLDVLRQRLDRPEEAALAGRVAGSLAATAELLNEMLDIAKLEMDEVAPLIEEVVLAPLMADLAGEFRAEAALKGLDLRCLPCSRSVAADRVLLKTLLRNLLANALRYTDSGRIVFGARRAAAGLRIEIWDTGRGIPGDKLDLVFEDFYQLDNPERDRNKGTGLGLSIVRRIAALLGLRLELRSVLGRGTRIGVIFPATGIDPTQKKTAPPEGDAVSLVSAAS